MTERSIVAKGKSTCFTCSLAPSVISLFYLKTVKENLKHPEEFFSVSRLVASLGPVVQRVGKICSLSNQN